MDAASYVVWQVLVGGTVVTAAIAVMLVLPSPSNQIRETVVTKTSAVISHGHVSQPKQAAHCSANATELTLHQRSATITTTPVQLPPRLTMPRGTVHHVGPHRGPQLVTSARRGRPVCQQLQPAVRAEQWP